jgi:hypothetical protein
MKDAVKKQDVKLSQIFLRYFEKLRGEKTIWDILYITLTILNIECYDFSATLWDCGTITTIQF